MNIEGINREVRKLQEEVNSSLGPQNHTFERNEKMWGINRLIEITSNITKSTLLSNGDLKFEETEFLSELICRPCFENDVLALISREWYSKIRAKNEL